MICDIVLNVDSVQVCNCDAVLWFWATYESAQYCLLARLRTPLGMPPDTFTAIESGWQHTHTHTHTHTRTHAHTYTHRHTHTRDIYESIVFIELDKLTVCVHVCFVCVCGVCVCSDVLRGYAQEVESTDRRHLRDTPSSFSGHMGAGLQPSLSTSPSLSHTHTLSRALPALSQLFTLYNNASLPPSALSLSLPILYSLTYLSLSPPPSRLLSLFQFFTLSCFSPTGLGPRHYTVHLRAVLLLQFMEHLDKLMYNAYEGSCVTLPPVPKVYYYTTYYITHMPRCVCVYVSRTYVCMLPAVF